MKLQPINSNHSDGDASDQEVPNTEVNLDDVLTQKINSIDLTLSQLLKLMEQLKKNLESGRPPSKTIDTEDSMSVATEYHESEETIPVSSSSFLTQVHDFPEVSFTSTVDEAISEFRTMKDIATYFKRYQTEDVDKFETSEFVRKPNPINEKLLLRYHRLLDRKLNKSYDERETLKMAKVEGLPSSARVNSVRSLFHYLELLLWHKLKYYVPDQTLRSSLVSAVERVDQAHREALIQLVNKATEENLNSPTVGIKWKMVFDQVQRYVPVNSDDPLGRICQRLDDCIDLNVTMTIINADVQEFIASHQLSNNTGILWVRIWKELFRRVPNTMETALEGIDGEIQVIIKRTGNPAENTSDSTMEKVFEQQLERYNLKAGNHGSYLKFWEVFSEHLIDASTIITFTDDVKKMKKTDDTISTTTPSTSQRLNDADGVKTLSPKFCNVCSKEHFWRTCPELKELKDNHLLNFHTGAYHDKYGNPLPLERGEAILVKYSDRFKDAR